MINLRLVISLVLIFSILLAGFGCNLEDETPSQTENGSITVNTTDQPQNEVVVDYEKQDKLENPKEYIQIEADIHFSFKYPNNFSFIMDDNKVDRAYIHFSENITGIDYHAAIITVIVDEIGAFGYDSTQEFYQNRKDVIDEVTGFYIQDIKWTDGEKVGYQLVYSFTWGPPIGIPKPLPEGVSEEEFLEDQGFVRVISKHIIFEFHNYVWEFSFTAPIEKYKKQEGILESVIDSLTIHQ